MGSDGLERILKHFSLPKGKVTVIPINEGRINLTYHVIVTYDEDRTQSDFVLQKINSEVFHDPELIMINLEKLTRFASLKGLTLVQTEDDQNWYTDGNLFVRLMKYVAHTPIQYEDDDVFIEAGRAVGEFHKKFWAFPVNELKEAIPNFHHTPIRYGDYQKALRETSVIRRSIAEKVIDVVETYQDITSVITDKLGDGLLEYHVTHNDTKLDNILFSRDGDAICLIDFDTVMPGAIAWDIGDSIRSMANSVGEEETEVKKVQFLFARFKNYMKGYSSVMCEYLSVNEVNSLVDGCLVIVYEQGLRFLTDFLNDDRYYKVSYPSQNLVRAQVQFALFLQMLEEKARMERTVNSLFPFFEDQ